MISVERFRALKSEAEELERKAAVARGAYEQSMQTLASEFACDSIEAARESLAKMEAEVQQLDSNATALLKEYEVALEKAKREMENC